MNVGILQMDETSNTFCPAKWQELHVHFTEKYAYACCKAAPAQFVTHPDEVIIPQKLNLLNNVKDPSCMYCWRMEDQGKKSYRQERFTNQSTEFLKLEINLDNFCNFACAYCNPRFSSQWEADIKKYGKYPVLSDKQFYSTGNTIKQNIETEHILKIIKDYAPKETVAFIGGEPFLNPVVVDIAKSINNIKLMFSTNLSSAAMENLLQVIDICKSKNLEILLGISIDCWGDIAEFTRYGLNLTEFDKNINLVATKLKNFNINTLVTAHTIWQLPDLYHYLTGFSKDHDIKINWNLHYCTDPKIQTFSVLNESEITKATEILNMLDISVNNITIRYLDTIKNSVLLYEHKKHLRTEMQKFFQEYSKRKRLKIPNLLMDLING